MTPTLPGRLRNSCSPGGYRPTIARNGLAALYLAQSEQPAILLLDLGLPILDGWQVAKKLSASEGSKRPFVIAISGHSIEPFDGEGIDLHLVKPVDPDRLWAELRFAVRQAGSRTLS
jgi:DNA-binding response OmpR family regulator